MPELRLIPLSDAFTADQLTALRDKLAEYGVDELPEGEDSFDLDDSLGEDQLTDFMDRLEAHDIACDVYLPVEFEEVVEVGEHRFGSAMALSEALEEIREELDVEEEEEADEEDVDLEVVEKQMSHAWRVFTRAVTTCVERYLPLHVLP